MKVILLIAIATIIFTGAGIVKVSQGLRKVEIAQSTDWTCMSDCMNRYSYGYCKRLCSY